MRRENAAYTTTDAGPLNTGLPWRYTPAEEARALDRLLADLELITELERELETPSIGVSGSVTLREFKPDLRGATLTQAA